MNDTALALALALPYPGLRPFEEGDHPVFFGREDQLSVLLQHLEDAPFVAVIGSSGSGKSSLVRAGLLPLLRDGFLFGTTDWRIVIARPGRRPFDGLAAALDASVPGPGEADVLKRLRRSDRGLIDAVDAARTDPESRVLVVIDQFEELFGFRHALPAGADSKQEPGNAAARDEAAAFVAMLLQTAEKANDRVRVLLTMRSDFMGDCDVFLGLPQAISRSQFLVPRLTRSQMETAIVRPGRVRGAAFEPFEFEAGLVTRLINDAGDRPDQLPLLQHALMRTWKLSDKRLMTHGDYDRAGRIDEALSQDADAAWKELGDERLQGIARRMFLLLCDVSAEGQFTRRRPLAGEVMDVAGATAEEVESIVRTFQRDDRSFLLFPASKPIGRDDVLDISHESLLRQWKLMGRWIVAETEAVAGYRRLIDAVEDGEQFLEGPRLERAVAWRASVQPTPSWAERYDARLSTNPGRESPLRRCLELIDDSLLKTEKMRREQSAEQEGAFLRLADEERSREGLRARWLRAIYYTIFGFDYFIVYRWGSGSSYAVRLAARLHEARFNVFLDRAEFAMGDDWRAVSSSAVRRTHTLVVIATRDALRESSSVAREIEVFSRQSRRIIPIVFSREDVDVVKDHPSLSELLYIEEPPECLTDGPSFRAVEQIVRERDTRRRRALRRQVTLLAALICFLLIVIAIASWRSAVVARQAATSAQGQADFALSRQVELYRWPVETGGRIFEEALNERTDRVREAAQLLTSGVRPYASTPDVQAAIGAVAKAAEDWEQKPTAGVDDLRSTVLALARACRRAWERERDRLGKGEDRIDPVTLRRLNRFLIEPPYRRIMAVLDRIQASGTASRADRAEFEALFWSDLPFIETNEVADAMVEIRREIQVGRRPDLTPLSRAWRPVLKGIGIDPGVQTR